MTTASDPVIPPALDPELAAPARTRGRRAAIRGLLRDPSAIIGFSVVAIILVVTIGAPLFAPYDPVAQDLAASMKPPAWLPGGSTDHLLGTDSLGRDVLSRVIYGGRIPLMVGVLVVLLAGAFGVVMGLIAGFTGGRVDSVIMRVVDTQTSFPGLLLAITILAVLGPSVTTVIVVLAINGWMVFARLTRSLVLSAKAAPYVDGAELIGARPSRVLFRHIAPNIVGPMLALVVLEFARIVLAEAALSFLGVGVQPPEISWGLDISTGRRYLYNAWWLVTMPGVAIALTVLAVNLVTSWLRVFLDPHEQSKRFARLS